MAFQQPVLVVSYFSYSAFVGDWDVGETWPVPEEDWTGDWEYHWRGARHGIFHENDAAL